MWPKGSKVAELEFAVSRASKNPAAGAVVVWQNARLRFRREDGRREPDQPLKAFVTPESARRLAFGKHPQGTAIGETDFAIAGEVIVPVSFQIPKTWCRPSSWSMFDWTRSKRRRASFVAGSRTVEVDGEIATESSATSTAAGGPGQ